MAADVLDTVPTHLEQVKQNLEILFEQTDQISALVKKSSRVQQISRYLWRLPMKLWAGGDFAKYVGNAGALPPGTGMKTSNLSAAYFYSALGYRVTQEQIDTSNPSQSVINVLSDTLANAMVEAGVQDDIAFHTKGDGILTNSGSATNGTTTITFAGATDTLNVSLLREGMCVDVWDSTGATKRAAATADPIIIIAIDYSSMVVTFNQTVTGIQASDILAFRGMAAYGPSSLTTFASTYPGTAGGAPSGGIGGDSFRHGMTYMLDTNSSNYFYGKQKSAIPQLNPIRVNAQSQPFEWDHIHRLISQIIRRRDKDAWRGWTGIVPMAQRASVFNLGIQISTKLMTTESFGGSLDLMPNNIGYSDTFNLAGIPCYISKRMDRSKMFFLNFNSLGRAQLFDTKFLDLGGRTTFEARDSTGAVNAAIDFWIVQAYDFVSFDGGSGGVIDSLSLPLNWTD